MCLNMTWLLGDFFTFIGIYPSHCHTETTNFIFFSCQLFIILPISIIYTHVYLLDSRFILIVSYVVPLHLQLLHTYRYYKIIKKKRSHDTDANGQ